MQNIKPVQKYAKYEMKPVQDAQVSYFAHFSRLFFCNFVKNGYFHFFLFFFFFFWVGEGGECGGGDIGSFLGDDYSISIYSIVYF